MKKTFNPEAFDPRVLADSLAGEIERQFRASLKPVDLLTIITYEPYTKNDTVITDGHIAADAPFIWGFMDFAPFYLRLRAYLTLWLSLDAEIVEVRIASDQFEEVICAKSGIKAWMHNRGSALLH